MTEIKQDIVRDLMRVAYAWADEPVCPVSGRSGALEIAIRDALRAGKSQPVEQKKCGIDFGNESVYLFRWKPAPKRTVEIGYMTRSGVYVNRELVAPEVEAPKTNEIVWFLGSGKEQEILWNNACHQHLLSEGRVFLIREDAKAMSDWLATCRKGGQS